MKKITLLCAVLVFCLTFLNYDVVEAKEQTTCPIMGGKINKNVYTDYKGKRVYFCCGGCVDTFKKDAEKYVKKMEGEEIELEKVKEKK